MLAIRSFKETEATPWPGPRTQSTLKSIGAEPQTRMLLFGGYVLNKTEQNDLWAVGARALPLAC